MELIRGIHNIRPQHFGCVLTIGNFDGVHLGHAAVLKGLLADAKENNLPSTVMLFEPQPQEFFAKNNAPARLTVLRDKLRLLSNLGIERGICISFNQAFANMHAEQFVSDILIKKLGVKALTVEGGGLGVVDADQVKAKLIFDPKGLLNPGKLEGWDVKEKFNI